MPTIINCYLLLYKRIYNFPKLIIPRDASIVLLQVTYDILSQAHVLIQVLKNSSDFHHWGLMRRREVCEEGIQLFVVFLSLSGT